jgi:hypothetical protein
MLYALDSSRFVQANNQGASGVGVAAIQLARMSF